MNESQYFFIIQTSKLRLKEKNATLFKIIQLVNRVGNEPKSLCSSMNFIIQNKTQDNEFAKSIG